MMLKLYILYKDLKALFKDLVLILFICQGNSEPLYIFCECIC